MNYIEVNSVNEIEIFARYNERRLLRINEPGLGIFVAESPEVIELALDAGYEPVSFLVEKQNLNDAVEKVIVKALSAAGENPPSCRGPREPAENPPVCPDHYEPAERLPVYIASHELMEQIPGYGLTRGMLCAFRRKPWAPVEKIIAGAANIAVLEDVMNPTNIGAIFRSAAALNIDAVLLTGGCSDPLYRRAARVSMGNVFKIPWTYFPEKGHMPGDTKKHAASEGRSVEENKTSANNFWPAGGIRLLKDNGFSVISMALNDRTADIRDERLKALSRKAIIFGTEESGITEETLRLSDYTVKIPMSHNVDSLNVAAASAVAFWELAGKA